MIDIQGINHCANVSCPNKVGEGRFTVVRTEENVVGGARPVILVMCSPCAEAMRKMIMEHHISLQAQR